MYIYIYINNHEIASALHRFIFSGEKLKLEEMLP